MAANSGSSSGGQQNFYGISYGYLSTKVKEVGDEKVEITEAELKAKMIKNENVDLRNCFVRKSGDYPFSVFFQSIDGVVKNVELAEKDFGKLLEITILDKDGETSMVSCKFYSKYSENFLNRFLNTQKGDSIRIAPYAIPSDFAPNHSKPNDKVKYYNMGVSLRTATGKVELKYTGDNPELPPTERQEDATGNEVTSRVKRIKFLLDKVTETFKFEQYAVNEHTNNNASSNASGNVIDTPKVIMSDDDELPF